MGGMKRVGFLCLLVIALHQARPQGTIVWGPTNAFVFPGYPAPPWPPLLNFEAQFGEAANRVQCAATYWSPASDLSVRFTFGNAPATNAWILQTNDDGTLSPIFQLQLLTNNLPFRPPPPWWSNVALPFPPYSPPGLTTNVLGRPLPGFGYDSSQSAQPLTVQYRSQDLPIDTHQVKALLLGRWWVEVDFEDAQFRGPLTVAPGTQIPSVSPPFIFSSLRPPAGTTPEVIAPNGRWVALAFKGLAWAPFPYALAVDFTWLDQGNFLGAGPVITNRFGIGAHDLSLIASDVLSSNSSQFTFDVITPAEAVDSLLARVDESRLARGRRSGLEQMLAAAASCFARGNDEFGLSTLQSFQRQLRQVRRAPPGEIQQLHQSAQDIIDAVSAGGLPVATPDAPISGIGAWPILPFLVATNVAVVSWSPTNSSGSSLPPVPVIDLPGVWPPP